MHQSRICQSLCCSPLHFDIILGAQWWCSGVVAKDGAYLLLHSIYVPTASNCRFKKRSNKRWVIIRQKSKLPKKGDRRFEISMQYHKVLKSVQLSRIETGSSQQYYVMYYSVGKYYRS